jgi:hypothetical protein
MINGCVSGDPFKLYHWIQTNGITEESCYPYQSQGWKTGMPCDGELSICQTCLDPNSCTVPDAYPVYNVTDFKIISTDDAKETEGIIMTHLQDGPVNCAIHL